MIECHDVKQGMTVCVRYENAPPGVLSKICRELGVRIPPIVDELALRHGLVRDNLIVTIYDPQSTLISPGKP